MDERRLITSPNEKVKEKVSSIEKSVSKSYEEAILQDDQNLKKLFKLTSKQRSIIEFPANPNEILSIRAGPGCGKTRTIIERIIYLVEELDFKPQEILVLSMANRSVDSIKHTLYERTNNVVYDQVSVSTFHSFCSSLEDLYGELYIENYVKKRIMDDLSWRNFASLFLSKSAIHGNKRYSHNLGLLNIDELIVSIRSGELSFKDVVDKYKVDEVYLNEILTYLDRNGMVRFPDLITNALKLIDLSLTNINDSSRWISQLAHYKVVIVDEFQDMHPFLLKILKKILEYPTYEFDGEKMKHLTIAGDPKQCIYEFLGSNPKAISQLSEHFPKYKIIEMFLNQTFRLSPQNLKMCLFFSGNSTNENDIIYTTKPSIYKPILSSFSTDLQEYYFIIEEILRLICQSGGILKPSDFLILARSNMEIEKFAKVAEVNGVQYNKFSSSSSWIKSKVHMLLDILNVLNNGNSADFGLLCLIMILDKRLGNRRRITKLFNINNDRIVNDTRNDIVKSTLETYIREELTKYEKNERGFKSSPFFNIYKLPDNLETIKNIRELIIRIGKERLSINNDDSPESITESLFRIVKKSPLIEYLNDFSIKQKKLKTSDINNLKLDLENNLLDFKDSLVSSYNEYSNLESTSETFLDYFLRTYNDDIPTFNEESINISTIHSAKGLEFPIVFLLGTKQGDSSLWDSISSEKSSKNLDSNRRLFYVASTRAKNLLYISTAKKFEYLSSSNTSFFTNTPPDLISNDSFIINISNDLRRKIPSKERLTEGRHLFQNLKVQLSHNRRPIYDFGQVRRIHYDAYKSYFRVNLKICKVLLRVL